MKCSKCGKEAIVLLRYAKLALCKEHYVEYVERKIMKVLKKAFNLGLPKRVLVAISGGKDSMSLLYALHSLSKSMDFTLLALFIDLGIPNLSSVAKSVVKRVCEKLGVKLLIVDLREILKLSLPELAKKVKRDYCSVCGLVKRYIMNAAGVEANAIVATGHHLDDVVSYVVKGILFPGGSEGIKVGAILPPSEGACAKIRPLIRISEREVLLYAILKGVEYVEAECPYAPRNSVDKYIKKMLSKLEALSPGIKLGILSKHEAKYSDLKEFQASARTCSTCGLISSGDTCSFCKYTSIAVGKPLGYEVRKHIRERIKELIS